MRARRPLTVLSLVLATVVLTGCDPSPILCIAPTELPVPAICIP